MEQRICVKYCYETGQIAKDCYGFLKVAFVDETASLFSVCEWYRRSKSGWESRKGNCYSGDPSTLLTDRELGLWHVLAKFIQQFRTVEQQESDTQNHHYDRKNIADVKQWITNSVWPFYDLYGKQYERNERSFGGNIGAGFLLRQRCRAHGSLLPAIYCKKQNLVASTLTVHLWSLSQEHVFPPLKQNIGLSGRIRSIGGNTRKNTETANPHSIKIVLWIVGIVLMQEGLFWKGLLLVKFI